MVTYKEHLQFLTVQRGLGRRKIAQAIGAKPTRTGRIIKGEVKPTKAERKKLKKLYEDSIGALRGRPIYTIAKVIGKTYPNHPKRYLISRVSSQRSDGYCFTRIGVTFISDHYDEFSIGTDHIYKFSINAWDELNKRLKDVLDKSQIVSVSPKITEKVKQIKYLEDIIFVT